MYKEKLVLRCIYNLAWYLKALYIICTLHKSPVSTCTLTGDISLPVYKISLLIFYCCMAVICIYMTEYIIIKASAILILWFTNFVSGNTLYILKHTRSVQYAHCITLMMTIYMYKSNMHCMHFLCCFTFMLTNTTVTVIIQDFLLWNEKVLCTCTR